MPFFFEKCKVELNGKTFMIDPSSKKTVETLDRVMNAGSDYMKGKYNDISQEEQEKQLLEIIHEAVDQICGAGTFEEVFSDHVVNVFDAMEVWGSICNDIAQYKLNRIRHFSGNAGA